jgi:Kef-type K+ transport system membrane component KefB
VNHLVFHPLLALGLLLIAGYVAGLAANALRLPRVTGYIIAGMIMSPSITGTLSRTQVETHTIWRRTRGIILAPNALRFDSTKSRQIV